MSPEPEESPEPSSGLGKLHEASDAAGGAAEQPVQPVPRRMLPWLTLLLIAVNCAVAIAESLLGGSSNAATQVFFGAKDNALIEAGDFWRLVTANFLHAGFGHLFFNMLGLLCVGSIVEAFYGRARYLVIYVLSGVGGTLASFEMQPGLSVGASAALFGLAGALMVHNFKYRAYLPPAVVYRMSLLYPLVLLQLVLGYFIPWIDLHGHVGGLVVGVLLALITESRVAGENQGEREGLPLPAAFSTALALLLYGAVGFALNVPREIPLLEGAMAEARSQDSRAVRLYQEALRRQPELEPVRETVALLLLRQQRWEEARAEYQRLLRRRPVDELTFQRYLFTVDQAFERFGAEGRWREGLDVYRELLKVAPNARRRAEAQNSIAYTLADKMNSNLEEARELAEAATAAEPDNFAYLDTLAWVYYRLKRYPDAERVQRLAVRHRGGDDPEVRYHMGAIAEALGKSGEAAEEYRAAVQFRRRRRDADSQAAVRMAQEGLRRLAGGT